MPINRYCVICAKKQTTYWDKLFLIQLSERELIFWVYKEFSHSNKKNSKLKGGKTYIYS
jgi:hypothetical protein